MYKILERTIDYNGLLKSKDTDWVVSHYGLFNVNYHNGEISSIDSDEPVD